MGIFTTKFEVILQVNFCDLEFVNEAFNLGVFIYHPNTKHTVPVKIHISDRSRGHDGKLNQHSVTVKITGRKEYGTKGLPITVMEKDNSFIEDEFKNIHRNDIKRIKNFINHNRKYIREIWLCDDDTNLKNVEIKNTYRKIIEDNIKKYDYKKAVDKD